MIEEAAIAPNESPCAQPGGGGPLTYAFDRTEFWRAIPAWRDVDAETFGDFRWQQRNSVTSIQGIQQALGELAKPALIADIEGIQLLVVNEPNRRYPKLDDILLVSGLPPSGHDTDINNDGVVDGKDFLAIQRFDPSLLGQWAIDYGGAPSVAAMSAAQATIPEPGTSISLGMCLLCLSAASRRYVFRQVGA